MCILFITSVTFSQSVDWIHNKNISILIEKWYEMLIHDCSVHDSVEVTLGEIHFWVLFHKSETM